MDKTSLFSGDRGSNINPEENRTNKNSYYIPQFLQENFMSVPQTSSPPLHLMLIAIHSSSILMSFEAMFCEISGLCKGIVGVQVFRDVTPCLSTDVSASHSAFIL
jgi:hypothetical protein